MKTTFLQNEIISIQSLKNRIDIDPLEHDSDLELNPLRVRLSLEDRFREAILECIVNSYYVKTGYSNYDSDTGKLKTILDLPIFQRVANNPFPLRGNESRIQTKRDIQGLFHSDNILRYFIDEISEIYFDGSNQDRDLSGKSAQPRLTENRLVMITRELIQVNKTVNFSLLWKLFKIKNQAISAMNPRKRFQLVEKLLKNMLKQNSETSLVLIPTNSKSHGINLLISTLKTGQIKRKIPEAKTVVLSQIDHSDRISNEDGDRFYSLYKKYISGICGSLSYTFCASKLTRVQKLYHKELIFTSKPVRHPSRNDIKNYIQEYQELTIVEKSNTTAKYRNLLNRYTDISKARSFLSDKHDYNPAKKVYYKWLTESPTETTQRMDEILNENQPTKGNFTHEDFLKYNLEMGIGTKPLIISGEAGMGKTVAMTNFALGYVSRLEEKIFENKINEIASIPFPIYLRAKRIIHEHSFEETISRSLSLRENDLLCEYIFDSLPEMREHISSDELQELISLWKSIEHIHSTNLVYFIDGLDECRNQREAKAIVEQLTEKTGRRRVDEDGNTTITTTTTELKQKPTIVISTRPTHEDIIMNNIPDFGLLQMKPGEYYTEEELSNLMPVKLCDAWGITRESGRKLSEVFDNYKETLIHPLYIGWFCFIIQDGKLGEIEASSNEPEISRYNLISKIIDIGIESSLKRRESNLRLNDKIINGENFRDLIFKFISVAYYYDISNPKEVFSKLNHIWKLGKKTLTKDVRKSILEDCGVLFLAGNKIEWTHRTTPEIVYADFFIKTNESIKFGPLKLSEPVLDRISQLEFENNKHSTFKVSQLHTRFKYLPSEDFQEYLFEYTWNLNGEFGDSNSLISINKSGDLIASSGLTAEALSIAELYLQNLSTPKKFALIIDQLDSENRDSIISKIYDNSLDTFGLDLLRPIHFENVIPSEKIILEKLVPQTRIVDCIRYYRNMIYSANESGPIQKSSTLLLEIEKAKNYDKIFDIQYANGMCNYDDEGIYSWFSEEKDWSWFSKYVSDIYVKSAFKNLFGEDNYEECINIIWEEIVNQKIPIIVGRGDEEVVIERRVIIHFMEKYGLIPRSGEFYLDSSDLIEGKEFDSPDLIESKEFDFNNITVRGIFLAPIINECILASSFLKGKCSTEMSELTETFWLPYEMVKNYHQD